MRSIHIIEDNELITELLLRTLGKGGFDVTNSLNGEDGLKACFANCPELLILDLSLPGLGGIEVLKSLRRTAETKNLKILILTADATTEAKEEAKRNGATAFMAKPFESKSLAALVEGLISQR